MEIIWRFPESSNISVVSDSRVDGLEKKCRVQCFLYSQTKSEEVSTFAASTLTSVFLTKRFHEGLTPKPSSLLGRAASGFIFKTKVTESLDGFLPHITGSH